MELNTKSDLNFHEGLDKVSILRLHESQPSLGQALPTPGESPVPSELQNLFRGYSLQSYIMDSLAPESSSPERASGRILAGALAEILDSIGKLRPRTPKEAQALQEASQAMSEDLANHELLDAFRRALLGG